MLELALDNGSLGGLAAILLLVVILGGCCLLERITRV